MITAPDTALRKLNVDWQQVIWLAMFLTVVDSPVSYLRVLWFTTMTHSISMECLYAVSSIFIVLLTVVKLSFILCVAF